MKYKYSTCSGVEGFQHLESNFVAFAGKINLLILIDTKIKVLICSSYRSEWFLKKKKCP